MKMNFSETIIEGQKIFYGEKFSDASEPLVVFLHGWGSFGNSFARLFDTPQNILVFDFPNSGKSSALKKVFTLEDYTRITKILIEKIQKKHREKYSFTHQKIILVGHSFGGRVIAQLLHLYPEIFSPQAVEKIICIAVPFYREKNIKTQLLGTLVKYSKKILPESFTPFFQKIAHTFFGENDYFDLSQDKIMKQTFQNIVGEEIEPYLSAFSQYSLFCFWGENDDIIPLWFATKAKKEKIPDLKIFPIASAGHFPWIDNPSSFLKSWKGIFEKI